MKLDDKLNLLKDFIAFVQDNDNHSNLDDIRSVTTYSFYQISESFLIGLILSKHLSDIDYCKEKISPNIENSDLQTLEYAFDGYIKDSFFIKLFVLTENHIRQIAKFYESSTNKIDDIPISATFNNLMNSDKISFSTTITEEEKELFRFYCYLRNTMHNIGFQSQGSKQLNILDSNSVINKNDVIIDLTKNSVNSLTFEKSVLLQEQIFKLILKMNSLIPKNDFIEHRLVSIGFNS